jgi:hypothetical protein
MSDEVSDLHALILSAHHAKWRARLLDTLREGRTLTPAEGAALADYIDGLTTPGKRGPKGDKNKIGSAAWWKQRIVTMARARQKWHLTRTGKRLTNEQAIDQIVAVGGSRGEYLDKYRKQALQEMNKRGSKGARA